MIKIGENFMMMNQQKYSNNVEIFNLNHYDKDSYKI